MYLKGLPEKPTFSQRGLEGFRYPLENKELEVYQVAVTRGHDNIIISKRCTHIYYVLRGNGIFSIDGADEKARAGDLVEIPPGVEYCYSGRMELLLIMQPPWFEGNEVVVRGNPAVKK